MGEVIILEIKGKIFSILNRRDNFKSVLSVEIKDKKQLENLKKLKGKYRLRVNREFRCDKCGKQIAISIIPYQRMGQINDICLCHKDDPYTQSLIKQNIAKINKKGKVVLC